MPSTRNAWVSVTLAFLGAAAVVVSLLNIAKLPDEERDTVPLFSEPFWIIVGVAALFVVLFAILASSHRFAKPEVWRTSTPRLMWWIAAFITVAAVGTGVALRLTRGPKFTWINMVIGAVGILFIGVAYALLWRHFVNQTLPEWKEGPQVFEQAPAVASRISDDYLYRLSPHQKSVTRSNLQFDETSLEVKKFVEDNFENLVGDRQFSKLMKEAGEILERAKKGVDLIRSANKYEADIEDLKEPEQKARQEHNRCKLEVGARHRFSKQRHKLASALMNMALRQKEQDTRVIDFLKRQMCNDDPDCTIQHDKSIEKCDAARDATLSRRSSADSGGAAAGRT